MLTLHIIKMENGSTDTELPQDTLDCEPHQKSVNPTPLPVEKNLIDLNTPNTPLKGSTYGLSNGEITDSRNVDLITDGFPDLITGEPSLIKSADSLINPETKVHKSISSYSTSTGNGLDSNSLLVSHTESGYLTDSVTSHVSQERHPSVSGSEADKTPSHETRPSSSSENDITPCTEKLFALSDSLARLSTTSNRAETGQTQKAKSQKLIDFDNEAPETRLETLNHIDSDCDRNNKNGELKRSLSSTRPESLSLSKSAKEHEHGYYRNEFGAISGKDQSRQDSGGDKYENRKRSKSYGFPIPRLKEGANIGEDALSKSLPHGQIVKSTTGMIEFVADDLMEKIRRSSPMSKTASSDVSSRRSSQLSLTSIDSFNSSTMATSMTSGMSVSYPQSPDCMPPIDPMAVHEIEIQARTVADGLDLMMGNLRTNLHKMSAITVGCEEAYRTSVAVTCDSVDSSIKSMYALMAKCEELSKTMQPVYKLADQIKEIKRLLDRFEHQLADKP